MDSATHMSKRNRWRFSSGVLRDALEQQYRRQHKWLNAERSETRTHHSNPDLIMRPNIIYYSVFNNVRCSVFLGWTWLFVYSFQSRLHYFFQVYSTCNQMMALILINSGLQNYWHPWLAMHKQCLNKYKQNIIRDKLKIPTCEKYCTLIMFQWNQTK
jgi:hypothetical protein